jgi:hypothetical protein
MSSQADTTMDGLYCRAEEIEDFIEEFESCTLKRVRWTHAAHLTVALWYLMHYSQNEATTLIRNGIQRYNQSQGIVMTRENGYHETITLFYIWTVSKYIAEEGGERSIAELANGLIGGRYGERSFPLEYYSRDRLMSWEARIGWVEPDLKPLERI